MDTISSNEIRRIRLLHDKKNRDELGLFLVEGEKMVAEALSSKFEVVRILKREDIGDAAMQRISLLKTPPPAMAVVRQVMPRTHGASGLCLALDSVRDPGNFGTILRIADWFGVKCVFASHDCVEMYNPKVVQASMGAVFRVEVEYCDIPSKCKEFSAAGLGVFGTFLQGENIYGCVLPAEGLVVMGNEANGISAEVAECCTGRVTIPSFGGGAESLNVSIATAIVVSEFRRSAKL